MNHGKKILEMKREDTSVEELTAAVVGGADGLRKFRAAK
jgi:simple sugar transport system ATP-binding protein